jgi:SH3 domain-containing YSC84-like protein 1
MGREHPRGYCVGSRFERGLKFCPTKFQHERSSDEAMPITQCFLLIPLIAASVAVAADETATRVEKAATVLTAMTRSPNGVAQKQITQADCIAIIPGFKKGAAVVGVGYGRGFISCRNGNGWSAPGGITLESGSLGIQLGGETIDIVILSLDKERRSKLLSDRFTIGSDASAAWGNGKSAHDDPSVKILFFGHTKGAFAGFGLDGATLKPDDSGNKALYGKSLSNNVIAESGAETPPAAQALIDRLSQIAGK